MKNGKKDDMRWCMLVTSQHGIDAVSFRSTVESLRNRLSCSGSDLMHDFVSSL